MDELGVKIFPLVFSVEGKDYRSTLTESTQEVKQFYDMMREGKVITTSLPNIGEAQALLEDTLNAGKDVLYIGFSSALSGTFNSICVLMDSLAKQFPERKLISADTLAASGGEALILWHAMQLVREGKSIHDVANWVEENRLHCAQWFTVSDLDYLFRGGRVSKTSALAGSLLNIKPILHVDNEGRLVPVDKVRGRKKSIEALVDHFAETALQPASEQKIFITHGDCLEDAEVLADILKTKYGCNDIDIFMVDAVVGAHGGPDNLALYFMATER